MDRKDYELLERYLRGELDEASRTALEQRLEREEELAAELTWQQRMQQFLRKKQEREQLKAKLEKLGERHFREETPQESTTTTKTIPFYRRRPVQIAAGIAILIIAGWLTVRLLTQPSLYRQYADHPSLALTEMSGEGPDVSDLEQAFNRGDYEAAAEGLQSYLQNNPADTLALLYRGISLLETGQLQEAASIFSSIRSSTTDLQNLGTWYLALTYLRRNERARSREVLRSIPPEADKYEEARELLDRLD